jgi:hypothetical protein
MNRRADMLAGMPAPQILALLAVALSAIFYGREAIPLWAALLIWLASLIVFVWSNIRHGGTAS